jgi:type 1 glutamine amidotransferase
MRRPFHVLILAALLLALLPWSNSATAAPQQENAPRFKALVYSKINGFDHEARPYGVAALQKLAAENNFEVVASDDSANFTDETLAQYDVVVFNNTNSRNGPILDADQRAAFERYIQAGGGYMGIHSASGTEYDWAWYGDLMGAFFKVHPAIQDVEIEVDDRVHPSTKDLPQTFIRNEEPYDFVANPRGNVHVLASYDANSYNGDTMGADHPISWCQNFDGGRSWYTGMGHTIESFSEANFLHLLLGGIQTAAGAVPANCSVSTPPPTRQIVGTQSGRCVSVANSNGSQGQLADCVSGQASQTWTPTAGKQLMVYGSKCLDASGRGTSNGTQVIIWDCNGQPNQQWNVNSNGTITGVQSSLCIDASGQGTANGTKLVLWSCSGQANQQWTLR